MLPKKISFKKLYFHIYRTKKMKILKNRNSQKTMGVREKRKAGYDSTGPLQLNSTYDTQKISISTFVIISFYKEMKMKQKIYCVGE